MKLPIGISDFAKLRAGGYTLVDKSLLIKDIIDDGAEVILFTRPRRFGKTVNMSMLYHYFSMNEDDNKELFEDLAIWQQGTQYREEQGKYPTIFITLKGIKFHGFKEAYSKLETLIAKLYDDHKYLLVDGDLSAPEKKKFNEILNEQAHSTDVQSSLSVLTEYLHRYHGVKPIVIIDEYDSPIHSAYTNGYYAEMIGFMQHFLGEALKDNVHLHKGVITGILRVAKESIFSGLNNLKVHTILSGRYSQYFGFTEDEVKVLLSEANAKQEMLEQVKDWYNGYRFDSHTIYNPWSILNFIDESFQLKPYWGNTSDNKMINELVEASSIYTQNEMERLLQQKTYRVELEDDIVFSDLELRDNALWNFLLHTGYLTIKNKTQDIAGFYSAEFAIPNKEINLLYRSLIKRWFGTAQTPSSNKITQALLSGDMESFKKILGKFLGESFSYFDTQGKTKEQIYHVFVLGLVAHLSDYYLIRSNREVGEGRYDVVMLPKDKSRTGVIFEFKVLKKGAKDTALKEAAQQALEQIQSNHYLAEFTAANINTVLQLGLAFSGKQFEMAPVLVQGGQQE